MEHGGLSLIKDGCAELEPCEHEHRPAHAHEFEEPVSLEQHMERCGEAHRAIVDIAAKLKENNRVAREDAAARVAVAKEQPLVSAWFDELRKRPSWRDPETADSDGRMLILLWRRERRGTVVLDRTLEAPSPTFQPRTKPRNEWPRSSNTVEAPVTIRDKKVVDAVQVLVMSSGEVQVLKLDCGMPFEACSDINGFDDALAWLDGRGAA